MDEDMMRRLLASLMQSAPSYDKYGNVEPNDLDYQKSAANWQQDQYALMGDPLSVLSAGQGGFDASAYQDVQDGFDSYDLPANPLAPYLSLSADSEEGNIAARIARGESPDQIAKAWAEQGESDADVLARVRETANELFKGQFEFEQGMQGVPGMTRGEDGSWQYQGDGNIVGNQVQVPKMVRSKAAQQYDEMGLPTPDLTFGRQDFGYDEGRDFQREDDLGQLAQLKAAMDSAKGQFGDNVGTQRQIESFGRGPVPLSQRYKDAQQTSSGVPAPTSGMDSMTPTGPGLDGDMPKRLLATQMNGATPIDRGPTMQARQQLADLLYAPKKKEQIEGYDQYRDSTRKLRRFEAEANHRELGRRNSDRGAQRMADNHTRAGMTPLTMAALQRMQGLRMMGG